MYYILLKILSTLDLKHDSRYYAKPAPITIHHV